MIAKVKIAPVKLWCDGAKTRIAPEHRQYYLGSVHIVTDSMRASGFCQGKLWTVDQDWLNEFRVAAGYARTYYPRVACEHMLVMD